jgi:hypothetical protein
MHNRVKDMTRMDGLFALTAATLKKIATRKNTYFHCELTEVVYVRDLFRCRLSQLSPHHITKLHNSLRTVTCSTTLASGLVDVIYTDQTKR